MSKGLKYDGGKARWDLLPHGVVGKVVDVLTFGAAKYADNSWQNVEDGKRRYYAASLRHITAWWEGERYDGESGIHHLAHAACNLFFLMWLDEQNKIVLTKKEDIPKKANCPPVQTFHGQIPEHVFKPMTQEEAWAAQDSARRLGWGDPICSVFQKEMEEDK